MPVFGFRNEHAGQKRAEGQRQSRPIREPGKPQRDEQDVENEQLMRAPARHDVKPAAHEFLPDKEQYHEHQRGFGERDPQTLRKLAASLRDSGNHDQQGDYREVLEKQHSHDVASVGGFQLYAFGENAQDHCRRRHGDCASHRESRLPGGPYKRCGSEHRD